MMIMKEKDKKSWVSLYGEFLGEDRYRNWAPGQAVSAWVSKRQDKRNGLCHFLNLGLHFFKSMFHEEIS